MSEIEKKESEVFGMSTRGFMAILIVFTVCVMSFLKIAVVEPLYTLTSMAVGFYFGQKTKQ